MGVTQQVLETLSGAWLSCVVTSFPLRKARGLCQDHMQHLTRLILFCMKSPLHPHPCPSKQGLLLCFSSSCILPPFYLGEGGVGSLSLVHSPRRAVRGLISIISWAHLPYHSWTDELRKYERFELRVFQPWHHWHFELDNSLLRRAILCIVGCLEAPWPVAPHKSWQSKMPS